MTSHTRKLPSNSVRGPSAGTPSASTTFLSLVLAGTLGSISGAAGAADASTIPTAGSDIKDGDIIYFRSDAPIFTQEFQPTSPPQPPVTLCAPMYSRFNVQTVTAGNKSPGKAAANANPPDGKAAAADTQIVIGSFTSDAKLFHNSALPFPPPTEKRTALWSLRNIFASGSSRSSMSGPAKDSATSDAAVSVTCNGVAGKSNDPTVVKYDVPYEFTSDDFKKVRSQRMGFTWGGLLVPYKFYFTDRSFQSNTSAVGFVGYEGYFPGVNLAGIVALGPGTTSTTTASGTPAAPTTKSTTSVTYTGAAGVIATFGGVMKFGVVVGRDYQGRSAGFKYENKTWLALSIGAGF